MSRPLVGATVGAVLVLTWIVLGFWAFVSVALAMLVGALVGRVLDGTLDVRALGSVLRGRRSAP